MTTNIKRALPEEHLNPNLKAIEYAIRGPLLDRADKIQKELENGFKKPFPEITRTNIGDCHAMGQAPITFVRQLIALVSYPKLLNDSQFPEDVRNRARELLAQCNGSSIGSYPDSRGLEIIRKHVAEFIQRRDGSIPCDWQDIVLTNGAHGGIMNILKLFISNKDGKRAGVMIPIPQYPLYSATLAEFSLHQINYYLDESQQWQLNIADLQNNVDEARKVCNPRAIVVINPGNPTGQVLSRKNMEDIIRFAYNEQLFILADEVYQYNVYTEDCPFYSFKKVLMEMGSPYDKLELASLMSCSKGYTGECGLRGGYTETVNLCPKVKEVYMKLILTQTSSIIGQVCLDAIVNSPKKGDPSYETFVQEKESILRSLKIRAEVLVDALNSLEGWSCNRVQGAMYAFPSLQLQPKAVEAAKRANTSPDVFYAISLLEETGICVVPGSGFGQKPGTCHIRITILPPIDTLKNVVDKLKSFHQEFMRRYQ